jgi:methyl-accepting chemotaxis protein
MLAQIVEQVRKMDTLVAEIATASGEQSQGLEQITKAMTEMDTVTQSNAATAEESASVAHELSSQSTQLGEAVRRLNVFTGSGHQAVAISSQSETSAPATRRFERSARERVTPKIQRPGPSIKAGTMGDDFWR